MRLTRPVLLASTAALVAGVVGVLPSASADTPTGATLYFHSATGTYATDVATSPSAPGAAPAGATLSTAGPTYAEGSAASATTYGIGLRGTPTLPLFSLPVTGAVTTACFDVWASPDGSGNLLGTASLAFALVRPGLAAVDLPMLTAPIDDAAVAHVVGRVDVPAGTVLPAGSSLQVAGAYSDDPTEFYYDSQDRPSKVTFNCAASTDPTPTPSETTSPGTGTPGTSTGGTTFRNYTPPADMGSAAAEPSIGFSAKTGSVFMQGGYDTMRVRFDEATGDADWALSKDQLLSQITSLDPMGYVDRQTGRVFASQLVGACSLTEFNDADGEGAWSPSQGCGLPHGADHQTIGGGAFGPGGTSTNGYPNAVYYCSQSVAAALCALSRDGGQTFGEGTPIYTIADCGGLHGHVRVGPDGTAYVPNGNCGSSQVGIAYQTDGTNLTPWQTMVVPDSSSQAESDPSVAVDKGNRLWVGYASGESNGDSLAKIASYDVKTGAWSKSVDVGAAFGIKNVQFPDVVTGDAGRAAFSFFGTPTRGDDQAAGFTGVWHLYVAMTTDGGQTWTTTDATPSAPVQRGCIWLGGGDNPCRNLLDFTDITMDAKGRVIVGYADGCTGACETDPAANNLANLATIARQSSGKTLLGAYDDEFVPKPDVATTTTYTGATEARSGAPLAVSATVVPESGSLPAGGQVRYTLGGSSVTVPVGQTGTLPASAGTLTATYLGTPGFAPSTGSAPVSAYDVRLTPAASSATPVSGATDPVTVTAVRTDGKGTDTSWAGTPVLSTGDTTAGRLTCSAAVDGVARCGDVVLGDLGQQVLTAGAPGFLSGTTSVTVQPTGLRFVNPPATASAGSTTYTTAPVAGVPNAKLDGYAAYQSLTSNNRKDAAGPPTSCGGATCSLTITFGKGGGTRTLTAQDTSTPSRSATASTKVSG